MTFASTATAFEYGAASLAAALRDTGVAPGDTVYLHVSADLLGSMSGRHSGASADIAILSALEEAVGPKGTLLVPAYSFSFCRGEVFDVEKTPAAPGPWSRSNSFLEYFRTLPGTVRSHDPIHSVAARGPLAHELLDGIEPTCFGKGSIHDRLLQRGARVCLLGAPLEEASFRHFVEELAEVPFRFRKLFTGVIRSSGRERRTGWLYSVRILADNGTPDATRLDAAAREAGIVRSAAVGAGEVITLDCREFFEFTREQLRRDPWFTAKGPAGNAVAMEAAREAARTGASASSVELPRDASMGQIIDSLWKLPRHIVSDGYDEALCALSTQAPMTIHEFPSGSECWSWIVPEKWECREARLETLDGRVLFSSSDHPLHVVSYSLPFQGVVSRDELLRHLHIHPWLPDAVPFIFRYYERDWGLCCSRTLRDSLRDSEYRVVIDSGFSYGTLKAGEVVVEGESPESVVLCAHLCHPHMVNDDLTGVAVGIDVMRQLARRRKPRYTYRFLIVPETIGSVAWLSRNEHLIPQMKGGLFLEMLGLDYPHSLQMSFSGDSEADQCFLAALKEADPFGWSGPFRSIIGNDERQFNAPGVRVPMLSLSRVLPAGTRGAPYPTYHSSFDTPDRISSRSLEASRDAVLRMIDALEANRTPVNVYPGELFCSRFGLHIDAYENPEGNRKLFELLDLIDGTRSIAELALSTGSAFSSVRQTVERLHELGLVTFEDAKVRA